MKKFAILIIGMLMAVAASSQVVSLIADTAGTIAGTAAGVTHKYTSPFIGQGYGSWAVEVYVTASGTHATDSTHVDIYASYDGTNYFKVTNLGTPFLAGYATYPAQAGFATSGVRLSSAGATAGWYWPMVTNQPYRYIQVRVTQYKVASILTVNRAKLHLFK